MSTGRLVLELCLALLLLTAAVASVSGWAFRSVAHTAESTRTQATQATLELSAARSALVSADSSAMTTFQDGGAGLVGPGQDYQNQIAAAAQSLARFAQLDGSRDVQGLQVVEGMLAAYSGSIGQADAYQHQDRGAFLAENELWNASSLVHMSGGILDQLQSLQQRQQDAMHHRLRSGWMDPWTTAIWAAGIALLLGLSVLAQVLLWRRFRRRYNPGLLVASLLMLALAGAMVFTTISADRLRNADADLDAVVAGRQIQAQQVDATGQSALAGRLRRDCTPSCGYTVDRFIAAHRRGPARPLAGSDINDRTRAVNDRMRVAAETYDLGVWIVVVSALILVSITVGLYPRISEYRFTR